MVNTSDKTDYGNEKEIRKTVKVAIVDAKYFKKEGWLVVNVLTPTGEKRSCTLPTSNKYKGQVVSDDEAHRQMELTAEMFNKRRGSYIMMTCDEGQVNTLPEERIRPNTED